MTRLTAKQQAFINQMAENEELASHGFALLLKRDDFPTFFDALRDARLFEATRNPAPIPVAEEGYVRIPYWGALDYLVAVAKLAGEQNDLARANEVIQLYAPYPLGEMTRGGFKRTTTQPGSSQSSWGSYQRKP
jgi:hypothetical protein